VTIIDQENIVTMTRKEKQHQSAPETFADVIDLLLADGTMPATRKRDEISALNTLARLFNKRPEGVPANTHWLRQRLKQFHPKQAGISQKRYANIKSSVLSALRSTGAKTKRTHWLPAMTAAWQSLYELVPDEGDSFKLSRFFRHCSQSEIKPNEVDDQTVKTFEAMLVDETLVKDPGKIVRQAVNAWNKYSGKISEWPALILEREPSRQPWTFPLETFPQSFQDDTDKWCARLGMTDLFDDDAPAKACRPETIKHRRFQIRMMASALVRAGHDQSAITSLAYLVDVDRFKAGIRFMIDRNEGTPTEAIFGLAMGIKSIARHQVKVDEGHLDHLRKICSRLDQSVSRHRVKNKERLAQFDDPLRLARLLLLPAQLVGKSKSDGAKPRSGPLLLQTAAAIEILLYCPMRISNLAGLCMDRHLKWQSQGKERVLYISIPADEVKNAKPLHFELVGPSAEIVWDYINRARPALMEQPGDALFPKLDGQPKRPGDLSHLIKRTIFNETGLVVNAHLFRSLASKIHNRIAAGDLATISHVLGDRMETVMKSYAQFEQQSSLRRYQQSVNKLRAETVPSDLGGATS
jgi:integrase